MRPRILIIDEDPRVLAQLGMILRNEGAEVVVEHDAKRGLEMLKSDSFDVLFTEMQLQGSSELEILREAKQMRPVLPVVVTTACGSVESTVSAFRLGAVDYLTKPVRADQVAAALAKAVSKSIQPRQPDLRAKPFGNDVARNTPATVVAASVAMRQVVEKCPQIAESTSPILVVGELGVGKERVVQMIHSLSARRGEPLVKVNCEAMQEGRLVETFFGDEGAVGCANEPTHCGLIEQAAGGMLLLQNPTGLPRWMQQELVQTAQEGVFLRKGGSQPIAFRARIAASMKSAPDECLRKGNLLDELYYHLGVTPIIVPPLRNRREDICPLVDALVQDACCDPSLSPRWSKLCFSDEAMQLLEAYDWPGNIHELRNFIRRVFVFAADSEISAADVSELLPSLPAHCGADTITVPFVGDLKLIERAIVAEVINRAHGNKSAAARSLGLHRKTLYRIIENNATERPRLASG